MAQKTFTNFTDLAQYVSDQATRAVRDQVAPVVEDMLQSSAARNAAGDYSRMAGGIADPGSIVSEVQRSGNEITLRVKDIALPQDPIWGDFRGDEDTFSRWIENGEWMDIGEYIQSGYQTKAKRAARPFVAPVQDALGQNPGIVMNALKKGL